MNKIREYYDEVTQDVWSCSLCQKVVRSKNTSNLIAHFRRYHTETLDKYVKVRGADEYAFATSISNSHKSPAKVEKRRVR